MDKLITPEISINVPSKYILYPISSNFLSNLPLSELPDTMPQIEEEIENDIDEKKSDEENGKIKIDNKMGDISIYK
jgi:hypothetical protein